MRQAPTPITLASPPRRARRLMEAVLGVLLVVALLAVARVVVRPALVDIGSTAAERSAAMPADDVVTKPQTVMTRSVTLSAPPDRVWPWLVQMGVGKGGFYGYDWLENLGPVGVVDEIVNADRINPAWQQLEVGDHVAPMPGSTDWTVTTLRPRRLLVITDDHDWSWVLQLRPLGDDRTRLVTRMRWAPASAVGGRLGGLVFDLGDQLVIARMLHGLEQRVTGTLPGMPGTRTGDPAPLARLPLSWFAATGWLVTLALLAAAVARLTVRRRGGWAFLLAGTTALAWCLWTDTDPWSALGHHWPAAAGALGLVLALAVITGPPGRREAAVTVGRAVRFALPVLAAVGVAVVLPALTVWNAATAAGLTDGTAGQVVFLTAGSLAAAASSASAWWAADARPGVHGLLGAAIAGLLVLVTGSVLAGAVPAAAALLPLIAGPPQATTGPHSARHDARPYRPTSPQRILETRGDERPCARRP